MKKAFMLFALAINTFALELFVDTSEDTVSRSVSLDNVLSDLSNPITLKSESSSANRQLSHDELFRQNVSTMKSSDTLFISEETDSGYNEYLDLRELKYSSKEAVMSSEKKVSNEVAVTVQNQESKKKSISRGTPIKRRNSWLYSKTLAFYGGINRAGMRGESIDALEETVQSIQYKWEWNSGAAFYANFNDWFAISLGVQLTGKGFTAVLDSYEYSDSYLYLPMVTKLHELCLDYSYMFLELPLKIRFLKELRKRSAIFYTAGFAPSLVTSAEYEYYTKKGEEGWTKREESLGKVDLFDERELVLDSVGTTVVIDYDDFYKRTDFSVLMGFGYQLKLSYWFSLFAEANFVLGLVNHREYSDDFKDEIKELAGQTILSGEAKFQTFVYSGGVLLTF